MMVRILVIEDVNLKFFDLRNVIYSVLSEEVEIERVVTVVDAEDAVKLGGWDLIVLDISMDISLGSAGPMGAGHANLGGIDVIERMYLGETEAPTVIVTGFDYFPLSSSNANESEMVSLADLEKRARNLIGENLLACIRYGAANWQSILVATLQKWKEK